MGDLLGGVVVTVVGVVVEVLLSICTNTAFLLLAVVEGEGAEGDARVDRRDELCFDKSSKFIPRPEDDADCAFPSTVSG